MIVDIGLVALTGVGDDASGHCSGDLTHGDAVAVGLDADGAPLVVGARLGEVGGEEASAVMAHVFHGAVDGIPVGVDVERRHEDGEHDGLRVEVFTLVDLFDGDDVSVDGADHHVLSFPLVVAAGASEEIEDEEVDDHGDDRENQRQRERRQEKPYRHVERQQHDGEEDKYVGAFAMYLHFSILLKGDGLSFSELPRKEWR